MKAGMRIVEDEIVYGGWWRIHRVVLANRSDPDARLVREVVQARAASAVLLHDRERDVVMLVRQFRPAAFLEDGVESLLEVCAGVAEPGEDPTACAIREAMEETGVAIRLLRPICSVYPSPGVCTEKLDLFIADYSVASRTGAGGGLANEGEATEPTEMPFASALAAIDDGGIVDAKTIILLQRLALERAPSPVVAV
jgi:GDP-mannose pyrophosphatase NudK